jgi:hypothetical protein
MRQIASMVTLFLIACSAGGCKSSESAPAKPKGMQSTLDPRAHSTWEEKPMEVVQKPTSVREGTTPLAHIFYVGGPVRVMDLTAGVQIAAGVVGDQMLVRIDDKHGVIFGKETITPGPLPAGHRYAILADPTTENVFRQGIGPPARVDQPSSPSN